MENQSSVRRTLLNNQEAANYLAVSFRTLNNSRYTGLLGGITAPPYRKLGKSVRYEQSALDAWLDQINEQTSTSEDVA